MRRPSRRRSDADNPSSRALARASASSRSNRTVVVSLRAIQSLYPGPAQAATIGQRRNAGAQPGGGQGAREAGDSHQPAFFLRAFGILSPRPLTAQQAEKQRVLHTATDPPALAQIALALESPTLHAPNPEG